MDCKIAFFDLRGPSADHSKPLMLHELLFCPLLTWACEELSVRGIQRFFIICDEKWQTEVQAAAADFEGAALFTDADAALAAADGAVLMIPSPVLPVDVFSISPVYVAIPMYCGPIWPPASL